MIDHRIENRQQLAPCGEHGVVQVLVPWAASRFTLLFERLALDVLRQCDVSDATQILRISWDKAWGLRWNTSPKTARRKVSTATTQSCRKKWSERSRGAGIVRTVVWRIGVDEKAAAKEHRYLTLVCDLDGGTAQQH